MQVNFFEIKNIFKVKNGFLLIFKKCMYKIHSVTYE